MTPEEQTRFEEARRDWEERTLKPSLARSPERPGPFADSAGAPVERLHTPADTAAVDYVRDLGFPGEFPYTRGVQPTMYRGRFWTMRQYAGFGSATETNQRFRYLLEQGQSGLSVAFDLPTQMGYDADHEVARSEVGKVGVAISSVEDMAALFDAIPLDRVSTSMTINATASILLCLYMAVGERQGVSSDRLSGTVQNDILKEYIARGTYVYPPGPSMRLITDTFAFCRERVPRWNTISISGYHLREAGSTAAQEVAFTLANGIAYVTAAQEAGTQGRRVRAAALLLLQRPQQPPRGGGQVPGGPAAVGPHHEGPLRRARPALADAPLPRPDRGQHAHRPAAGEQHRAGGGAGPGRGAGGLPVAAHQLDGRGPVPAERGGGAPRAPHPAGPGPRVRRGRHRGSARRLLLDRADHEADRGGGRDLHRQDRRPGRVGARHPVHAARDPGGGLPLPAGRGGQAARGGGRERVRHGRAAAREPLPGGRHRGPGPGRAPRGHAPHP